MAAMTNPDAIVVGSGPNGLAAAVTLAQAGLAVTVLEADQEIGGGARTAELTVPGLKHDTCSAVHPFAVASPFLARLPLHEFGLTWRFTEIDMVHPLPDGSAGVLKTSLEDTAAGLGVDGPRWRAVFGPLVRSFDTVVSDVLGPLVRIPDHPIAMLRLGIRAGLPASVLARMFRTEAARAIFAGCAAHIWRPFNRLASASVGTVMIAGGHRHGWPVAEGGSGAISGALAGLARSLGVVIETGVRITSLAELPQTRITLFDTGPAAFADIAGDRLAPRRAKAYRKFRYGPAAFKLDLAVQEGIPWSSEAARRAGTVHLGGTMAQIGEAESQITRGVMPARPFMLIGQQYLADPQRSAGDTHPVWAYAHVPHGYTGDAGKVMIDQIERYAPGFRERIVATHVTTPRELAARNPNYVGGDIVGGRNDLRGLAGRPVLALDNYATGIPGMYLCSASTPPGAGTHGMCGHLAARRALAGLEEP